MATNGAFSIAIVGGGVTGLALAVALHNRNIDVHVYEKSAALDTVDAGFLLNPGAIRALRLCDVSSSREVDGIASRTSTTSQDQRFLFLDGFHPGSDSEGSVRLLYERIFPSETAIVNRKEFLDMLSSKLPAPRLTYAKGVADISLPEDDDDGPDEDKQVDITFDDGTKTSVDAVVGCDGVTSKVRGLLLGRGDQAVNAQYAKQYSYRLQISMDKAAKIVGPDRAASNCVYLGLGKRFLTTPCSNGSSVQLVALCYDEDTWPRNTPVVSTVTRDEVLSHFQDWVQPIQDLIRHARPEVTRWAVFDQADNFPPTFAKGKVSLAGDAAHAMTPHLGSSLSAALGDVVLLTELLSDRRVQLPRHLAPVMHIYSQTRQPPTLWLAQASRRAGLLYFWLADEARSPDEDGRSHILALHQKAWNYEINHAVASAKQALGALLRSNDDRAQARARRAGVSQRPYTEMLRMYDYYERARQSEP